MGDCRVTTVTGLLCPLGPSDPVGLQAVLLGSQISGRARSFGRKCRAYGDIVPADKQKLNRISDISGIGHECPDIVSPLLRPVLAFEWTRMRVGLSSGEVSEMAKGVEAAEQARVEDTGAAGPPHPEGRAALGEHAGNVAGICDPIDRGHDNPQQHAAEAA